MKQALRVTYFQFYASMTEWLDEAVLLRYQAEIFGMYCAGSTVSAVANAIIEANHGLVTIDPE